MTLDDLEKSESSAVWVLNKTNPSGLVSFAVDSNSRRIAVNIPLTWIPFDLATRCTKRSLLESPQFRRIVSAGMIRIIDSRSAETLLDSDDARAEQQRVYASDGVIQQETMSNVPKSIKAQTEAEDVSGFIMNMAFDTDTPFEQSLNEIRRRASNITQNEVKYLAENASNPTLRDWAMKQMAKKTSG
jgi:hypothetical protein